MTAATLFVSYAHRDNCRCSLAIATSIAEQVGTPFVDRLYDPARPSTPDVVHSALRRAELFAVVMTPNYLTTPWTVVEFETAKRRGLTMFEIHLDALAPRPSTPIAITTALTSIGTGRAPRCAPCGLELQGVS